TIRHGVTLPDGGICTTLRDLARFALMHPREGRVGETEVVPREWVLDTRRGDDAAREAYANAAGLDVHPGEMYRNQWWVYRGDAGSPYAASSYHAPPGDPPDARPSRPRLPGTRRAGRCAARGC